MATSFQLESLNAKKAVCSFATVTHDENGIINGRGPRLRYTVDFSDPGLPGAIKATRTDGSVTTLGMFRIDADTPHPGYMKIRNRVAALR